MYAICFSAGDQHAGSELNFDVPPCFETKGLGGDLRGTLIPKLRNGMQVEEFQEFKISRLGRWAESELIPPNLLWLLWRENT